ncbi:M48 family metalloprotease [Halopiger xanaduensis]|uniref:Peptidase M48 Ste24p n=1 Tax=Halopiger xanaduensis (strain DSM 18323 / JCM 14033 / SH-6) TaxID=797210 RepID=F8DB63_HALXS|nr:M48 family metalloprotease [Halopiger xanaduensis]AEH38552.1 peptidase M48 Ste24p [Halopiger xanaduensis SH-6]
MFAIVAFVLALAVGPFAAFRAYARRVATTDAPVEDRLHRLQRVQQVAGFVLPIVAVVGLHLLELVDRTTAVLPSGPRLFGIGVLEFAAIMFVSFGLVAVPLVSMALGTYPTIRSLRDTEASSWKVVKGVLAVLAIVSVTVAISIGGLLAVISTVGSSLPVLLAAFGTIVAASYGLSPYLIALFQDRVPLEGADRERVERLCAELEYRPRGLYLLEGESTKTANALVAGTIPGFRYVFLTDYLLSECDDDELQAILAHEFGHIAGRHLWQRGLLTVAVFGAWIAGADAIGVGALKDRFGFLGFFLPFMGLYALYHVGLLGGLAYRQEFRADAYAARRVGVEAAVDALEVLASANDMTRESGLLYALATHHPPIADRIDSVRDVDDEVRTDSDLDADGELDSDSDPDSRSTAGD